MKAHGRVGLVAVVVLFALLGLPGRSRAAEARPPTPTKVASISVPPGAGLKALTVTVAPEQRLVHVSSGGTESSVAIELGPEETSGDATAEVIAIGDGKRVVHVRVPSRTRSDVAWEALFAGRDAITLWSGVTGFSRGEAGELEGRALDLAPPDEAGERLVVVGDIAEDLRICGQARTLLAPQVLDPESLSFRGATMQRLPEAQREGAERVIASPHGGSADRPLARLLVATGASSAIGAPGAVTDGDPATAWSEGRATDGHGEFVVMRAPAAVPITRLAITIAPPSAPAHGAAPRTFFLVFDDRTLAVTLPEDAWMHPGAAYEIPFVDPLRTSCLTLVLDKAYIHAGEAHPDVTVAELTAYTAFDGPGATLDQVAKALGGGGARSDAAKEVLERAGDPGLKAVAAAYESLDPPGRALAIDAAIGAGTCEASAPLLLAAMDDRDREVSRKAGEKIERCGKRVVPALLAALGTPSGALTATAARLVASIAPSEALDPLVAALGKGGAPALRSALRSAIAKSASSATKEKLTTLVSAARTPEAELDLLRALEAELPAIAPRADEAIAALEAGAPSMRTRYLLVEPTAALARAKDGAATARLTSMIAADPDPAVRAHAAERAAGIPEAISALGRALDSDAAPRVREAALEALAGEASKATRLPVSSIARRLAEDDWTFVRAAAARALTASAPELHVDQALEGALKDPAPGVREAAVGALAAHGDVGAVKAIAARLADEHEALEVRLAAARALGALCDHGALDLLTALASRAPLPMASDEDIQIGFEAAQALGRLHPPDLAARLAPLAAKDARVEARTAAARALATTPGCR